jgi:hypothetical protein
MVAFWQDYQNLDDMLPDDAKIVFSGVRLNGFYAPRPVYSWRDFPKDENNVFLFAVGDSPLPLMDHEVGEVVYRNENAITQVFRSSKSHKVERLEVREIRNDSRNFE